MKKFNVTGKCYPEKHYMVDISERLEQIRQMVEEGDYFCINRGRQYGKTTTLSLLKKKMEKQYTVFSISFEGAGDAEFSTLDDLGVFFFSLLADTVDYNETPGVNAEVKQFLQEILEKGVRGSRALSNAISHFCSLNENPVVLIIDEVDSAGNHSAFIEFLGLLRDKFLNREERPAFWSVILSGVYDIKNLKLRIRPEEQHRYNSPWNIASEFDVDMDFSGSDIAGMLAEYETDHHTGMNIGELSGIIYAYTSGYPFLVSRLCKLIDEKIAGRDGFPDQASAWSRQGFLEAVKEIGSEPNTLFEDMRKKLSDFPNMREVLYQILYNGKRFAYNVDDPEMNLAAMFGYIRNDHGKVAVANRIFETRLYNLFLAEEQLQSSIYSEGSKDQNCFIRDGRLDMKKVLERFVIHFSDLYGSNDDKFIEKEGRKFFLLYLKPIINGTGNYYVEAQTRDEGRTDVIVDYLGEQFVVELKIWRGNAYHERGEQQLAEYLDSFHLKKGYMLSFNFNKNKEIGVKEIAVGDRILIEAVV